MATRKREPRQTISKHRASWRGTLSFGLVTFPVEAFNALDREHSDVHFHQLHVECRHRIRYKKVCPIHGELSKEEIVSGYEYRKGKYVEVDPEELRALRSEGERGLKIDSFVAPDSIDPLYFDGRMYYLVPAAENAQEPYAVITDAMERVGRHGVGRIVFSGKDQIVLIRPLESVLHMAMLNYEAEIRSPDLISRALKKPTGISRHVRLAEKLIEEWSEDEFDFSKYEDSYREKVKELIEAKMHGREIVPPAEEEPAAVLNLMDALKKSLGSTRTVPARRKQHRRSA